jgi:hypothetical protein
MRQCRQREIALNGRAGMNWIRRGGVFGAIRRFGSQDGRDERDNRKAKK